MVGQIFLTVLTAIAIREGLIQAYEFVERNTRWRLAREYSDAVDKPLLLVGMRWNPLQPSNKTADVVLDIRPGVLRLPNGVQGDIRDMPFDDKAFGACVAEHVIEHLHTPEDAALAITECRRVAEMVVIVAPSPDSLAGIMAPDHKLRLWIRNQGMIVEQLRKPSPNIDQSVVLLEGEPFDVVGRSR